MKKRFIPDDMCEQTGGGGGSGGPTSRRNDMIPLLLRLAKTNAFDEHGQIIGKNGPIEGTDIGKLVSFASRKEERLKGLDEFARLLARAGVRELPNGNFPPIKSSPLPPDPPDPPPPSPESPPLQTISLPHSLPPSLPPPSPPPPSPTAARKRKASTSGSADAKRHKWITF